ncbi:hypothetical protein ACM66B_004237 [Microbotryomycetes sp. NB124-2]
MRRPRCHSRHRRRNDEGASDSDSDASSSSSSSSGSLASSRTTTSSASSHESRRGGEKHRIHRWYRKAKRKIKTRIRHHRQRVRERYDQKRRRHELDPEPDRRQRHHKRLIRTAKKSLSFVEQHKWMVAAVSVLFVLTLVLVIVLAVRTARDKPVASPDPHAAAPTPSPTEGEEDSAPTEAPRPSSDSPSALASSFSMTRATVATLPMPTSEVLKADDAIKYVKESWPWLKGGSDFLSFRKDPFDGSGEPVLAIEYPKGSYSSSKGGGGGVGGLHLGVYGDASDIQRTLVSYEVAFDKEFAFVKGGKLPGAFGGSQSEGCTGGEQSVKCFSLRLMWRDNGAGEVYAYIPRYDALCAKGSSAECNDVYGVSLNRGSWTFKTGSWMRVVQFATLNTKPDPNKTQANGQLALYVDGELAFERSDIVYRLNSNVTFSSFLISSFFGGSTEDYASQGGRSYYRNFEFYAGTAGSDVKGDQVEAHLAKGKK